jgi:hypothetical protein
VLAVGVMTVPPAAADAVATAVDVRGRPGQDPGKLASWPGLERKIRERRAALGSSWEDVRRVAIPLDATAWTMVSAPVGPRRCVDILVVPADDVPFVDAHVLDASGRIVARGHPPGRDRAFVVCSEERQTVTLAVRPRLGAGLGAVVVARSPEGAASELADHAALDGLEPLAPLEQALARQQQRLAALALPAPAETRATVAPGVRLEVPLELRDGCSRIDVVGGQPLGAFGVELWSDADDRLGQSRGGEHATVFSCGARKARLEVTTDGRGGPIAVQVRLDPGPAAALGAQPLAAARLLVRLDAAAGPVAAAAAAAAEAVDLAPGRRFTREVDLAPGACAAFFAAAGDGPSALELRVADAAGRVATAAGLDTTATDAVCAGDGGRKLRLELEARHGSGKALLLRRDLVP